MKINVDQKILGIDGEPLKGVPYETAQHLDQIIGIANEINHDFAVKLAKKMSELLTGEKNLKDVILSTLMASKREASMEDKKKDFNLLMTVSQSDKPDIDKTNREYIVKRIWETQSNNLVAGRCDSLLMVDEEEESKPDKKTSKE